MKNIEISHVFLLAILSSCLTAIPFVFHHSLYWDNLAYFSIFRDHLQSINQYGELQLWSPNSQLGWPIHYYSSLGIPGTSSPGMILLNIYVYILRLLNIQIVNYFYLYIIYLFLICQIFFIISNYLLCNELFDESICKALILILSLLSPAVISNMSDLGSIEKLAAAQLFIYLLIKLLKGNLEYKKIIFISAIFSLSLGYWMIMYIVLLIPLFFLTLIIFNKEIKARLNNINIVSLASKILIIFITVFAFAALYAVIALHDYGLISLRNPKFGYYPLESFIKGNLWELISGSTPAIGFDWFPHYRKNWEASGFLSRHVNYEYISLTAIPLLVFSIFEKKYRKLTFLIIMWIIICSIFIMGNESYIFRSFYRFIPAKMFNHYNDGPYIHLLFIPIIYLSCIGLLYILKNKSKKILVFGFLSTSLVLFLINIVISIILNSNISKILIIYYILYIILIFIFTFFN
jgi:hypothetical protein